MSCWIYCKPDAIVVLRLSIVFVRVNRIHSGQSTYRKHGASETQTERQMWSEQLSKSQVKSITTCNNNNMSIYTEKIEKICPKLLTVSVFGVGLIGISTFFIFFSVIFHDS